MITRFILILLFFVNVVAMSQGNWDGFQKDSVKSSLDGTVQYFYYYNATGNVKQPLVVSLHQWGADYAEYSNSLAPQSKEKNWNYIHPDFRGKNNHIKACGSKYVIADIDDAIEWAIKNLPVDTTRIYVVGASGGGYAALCHFMKSRYTIKEYSVWVPITDLKKWYFESKSRKSHYAGNIIKCTCGDCKKIDFSKAVERSPLYWDTPLYKLKKTKLRIYAGVHDGYTGAVPISHSIFFYNKVVSELGGKDINIIQSDDLIWLLSARNSPEGMNPEKKLGNRDIVYEKKYENVSITIFEGGHEILVDEVLK